MASYSLVVVVVSANDLPGSRGSLNPSIELRFAGQKCSTLVSPREENCRHEWNETITFSALDENKISNCTLEAYVYNDTAGRKSFVGSVQIPGSSFFKSGGVAGAYPLRGGVFPRSKGTLQLEVLLKEERPIATSDPLSAVIPPNFLSGADRQPIKAEDARLKEIKPTFEHGKIVEHMPYVFVRVVKARHLPGADARGKLGTYVRVKVGGCRGTTKLMSVEPNAEWNSTFAFSKLVMDHEHVKMVYVTVYNDDKAKDDFVGMVWFDVRNIPKRPPPSDEPLVPEWYRLLDERGNVGEGELMLAVWMGSQADEAFPDATKPDSCMGPKVYNLPSLWYLRLNIIEFICVAVAGETKMVELNVMAVLGDQRRETSKKKESLGRHSWNEEFMFVAAEPFEGGLQIIVQAHLRPSDRPMVIGEITIPIVTFQRRGGRGDVDVDIDGHSIEPRWFDLKIPTEAQSVDGGTDDKLIVSSCRILLRNCLEGGYSVICDSTDNADDLRPAAMDIPDPPTVGLLEIGILGAQSLCPRRRANGELKVHPYCVAKYGRKWVRTRTIINTRNPVFNEQHAWPVYDTATVLIIGVFDNAELEGYSSEEDNTIRIGKVRIRLSSLQPNRTYANSYPLLALTPSGLNRLGELRLALRFSAESIVKMLRMYSSPKLPEMHYKYPISIMEADNLRHQAVGIVAARFSRMELPLRKEVVEYMCDMGSHMWSLRKSKVNFYRATSVFSSLVMFAIWFDGVRLWRKPATTLLVHAMFVMLVSYPELIIPAGLLYIFFVTARNYRQRPRYPPYFDVVLSHSHTELIDADELDEEFDLVATSRDFEIVRMRYDRLRCIAGRVQTILGDSVKYVERIQLLASWRDTTATTIFGLFTLTAAAVLYFVPWKILVALSGSYTMRHPMLRRKKTPSYLWNFFLRLPHKADSLI